jgi:hypothetical protein
MFVALLLTGHPAPFLMDLFAPIAGALLVGLGTYIGSRWALPYQRSSRLAGVLGVFYFVLGVVLAFPRKTHAIKIDLPLAGATTSSIDVAGDAAWALIAALSLVLFSMLLTRCIAALCKATSQRDT